MAKSVDDAVGTVYLVGMMTRLLSHEELLEKIRKLNPLLVQAIDEVDDSLLAEFKQLTIAERIVLASEAGIALESISRK
ncbi:MAG: hypothetical protein JXR76_25325 [Deltaproteobacteria bacterium]|nr:hypothetical protein [Deltaproteobacteria bacterium]